MTTHTIPTRKSIRRPTTVALSLAAVGALALSACGGGGSDDNSGIASIDDDTTEDASGSVDPELAMADYQRCLADNGVNLQIQSGGGGGAISLGGGAEADPQSGGMGDFDVDSFRAAADACSELAEAAMGAFTPDPQQQAEMEDAQLRFDECMTDKGLGGYQGSMAASSGISLDGGGGSTDPQSSGSLDDIDPDVLADALDECGAVFDELEAG